MGTYSHISQLHAFMDRQTLNGQTRFVENTASVAAWNALEAAFNGTTDYLIKRRVQFFRRTYSFVRKLIEVYLPIRQAFSLIEEFLPPNYYIPYSEGRMLWREGNRSSDAARTAMRTVLDPDSRRIPRPSWATIDGFRQYVRRPIHEFLGDRDGRVGLGCATIQSSLTDVFDLNLIIPEGKHMLNYGDVRLYTDWWNLNGRFNPRVMEILPHREGGYDFGEKGIGALIFVRMKELILAMMEVAEFNLPQGTPADADLEYTRFQRDA